VARFHRYHVSEDSSVFVFIETISLGSRKFADDAKSKIDIAEVEI